MRSCGSSLVAVTGYALLTAIAIVTIGCASTQQANQPAAPPMRYTVAIPQEEAKIYHFSSPKGFALPFGSKNIEVTGGRGGNYLKVQEGGSLATIGSQFYPDAPGSEGITVVVDPRTGFTELAGLNFGRNCVVNIWKDGTVEVNVAGILAKDASGRHYVSRAVSLPGRSVIIMVMREE